LSQRNELFFRNNTRWQLRRCKLRGQKDIRSTVGRFKTMNQRWMKRRIEKSRARCEATEKHVSARVDTPETGSQASANYFARIAEKQSSKLRSQTEVEQ